MSNAIFLKWKNQLGAYRFYLYILALLALVAYGGFQLGLYRSGLLVEQVQRLTSSVESLSQENQRLQKTVNVQQVELTLEKGTVEALGEELAQLNKQQGEMAQELAFYRKIMAPELAHQGFSFDELIITPRLSPGHYELTLILMQHQSIKTVLKGPLVIEVEGSEDGKPKTYGLSSLLREKEPLRFSFKYFQSLQRDFTLPEGFVPEKILVSAEIYKFKRKQGDLFKSWTWQEVLEDAP